MRFYRGQHWKGKQNNILNTKNEGNSFESTFLYFYDIKSYQKLQDIASCHALYWNDV
jgi:hypothetical protein